MISITNSNKYISHQVVNLFVNGLLKSWHECVPKRFKKWIQTPYKQLTDCKYNIDMV